MDDRPIVVPPVSADAAPARPGAAQNNGQPKATAAATSTTEKRHHDEGSVKETVEQILIAFILAFIFRAYVVEAFVIPTGSMAPTLLGAHTRHTCPDCGYEFDVNFSATQDGDDLNIPARAPGSVKAVCPTCGYQLRHFQPGDPAYQPFVRYGDRILVLKYLYLFEDPKRWDVVVFKSPDQPDKTDYTLNYIKRLVGRPGEAVMVLDGDIYAGDRDAKAEELTIQTKPKDVQDALWRVVHHNDYQPRGLPRATATDGSEVVWHQPWTRRGHENRWDLGAGESANPRVFTFDNLDGSGEIFFNPEANMEARPEGAHPAKPSAFDDWLAYDAGAGSPSRNTWNLVGDLKLDLFYERRSGDGPLRLMLSKRGERFIAEILPGSARLLRDDGSGAEIEVIKPVEFTSRDRPMHVVFSNVDYRITLRIDGVDVFQTDESQYRPDAAALLKWHKHPSPAPAPGASIIAAKQSCAISHLSVWRDVYYLNQGVRRDASGRPLGAFWAAPENIMRLNADEYFVMGDNSQISGDGRYWSDPTSLPHEHLATGAGKVPGRFMLGKAFFVYWPAGFRPLEKEPMPALSPNFGDMRFIH